MTTLWTIWTWIWPFGASSWITTTLQAAVHLGQDYEANLRYVKNHRWKSVGEFSSETGKLISEQKEITGVNTKVQRLYVDVAKLIVHHHPRQSLRLLRLRALCGKNGTWSYCDLEEQNQMVFGKYESNRRHADGVRVENIPRNHNVGPLREDSKSNVNLSTLQTGSSSCQCATTLNGKQEGTKKDVNTIHRQLRIMLTNPMFRASSAFERGELRSKGGGKKSFHFNVSNENIELLLHTVISAYQLSDYGAVAD